MLNNPNISQKNISSLEMYFSQINISRIMKYTNFGKTGIKVSKLTLGMMSFGNSQEWMLELDDARPLVERAIDAGINFFDTANVYSRGRSEEITGELLKDYRDDVVVATKVRFAMGDNINRKGLNRKHMTEQMVSSLDRLDMDYVDLYQIHRWDSSVDIEMVMRSLNQLIDAGLTLHIGASSMYAWQLAKHNTLQRHWVLRNLYPCKIMSMRYIRKKKERLSHFVLIRIWR